MPPIKSEISWSDFQKLDIRVGTVERSKAFPEARLPAIKLWIDFGSEIGVMKTSAQITDHYLPDDLVGLQVLAVLNFAPKQIGPFMSECLVLGAYAEDRSVILVEPNKLVVEALNFY